MRLFGIIDGVVDENDRPFFNRLRRFSLAFLEGIPPPPTNIISYSQQQTAGVTIITVVSDLVGAPIYYHWYVDGVWRSRTTSPSWSIATVGTVHVVCIATLDPEFDGPGNAPAEYPATRTIWWVRSLDPDVVDYLVIDATGVTYSIAVLRATDAWHYRIVTQPLDDLTAYTWNIRARKTTGRTEGITIGPLLIVRRPDPPNWLGTFDPGTLRVTFAAA